MSVRIWNRLKVQSRHFSEHLTVQAQEFRTQFLRQARQSLLKLAESLMEQEAEKLAGPRYGRSSRRSERIQRAGSDPGTVRVGHQRVRVRKQRLKQGSREIPLESYRALRQSDLLTARVLQCMIQGLSTRNYNDLLDEIAGGLGLSKSAVSRAFVEGSRQALEQLQSRDLGTERFAAIQIDALYFAKKSLIVALGIATGGQKRILGLIEGNTESATVCTDLLQSLLARGLRSDQPILFVLDGGKGLHKAVREVFGERCPIQRCLVHKARNLEAYVPERLHPELRRRWARIRRCERYSDAQTELRQLHHWLGGHSVEAQNSLNEAGEELLTCFRFGANRVLRRSLMTTNMIESMFARVRSITARIRNWTHPKSPRKDQIKRWTAIALLSAEGSGNYVRGHADLGSFVQSMEEKNLPNQPKSA